MATASEIEECWQGQLERLKKSETNSISVIMGEDILSSTIQMLEERRDALAHYDEQYNQIRTLEKTNKELEIAYDELYKRLQTLEKASEEPKETNGRANEVYRYITYNESIMIRKLMDTYEATIRTLLAVIEKGV